MKTVLTFSQRFSSNFSCDEKKRHTVHPMVIKLASHILSSGSQLESSILLCGWEYVALYFISLNHWLKLLSLQLCHKFNKTNYRIPGYYFTYRYRYCFLESHFQCINLNKRIKNIYIDTELVVPMYNAHPYFSLKNLGKKVHIIHGKIQ